MLGQSFISTKYKWPTRLCAVVYAFNCVPDGDFFFFFVGSRKIPAVIIVHKWYISLYTQRILYVEGQYYSTPISGNRGLV